MSGQQSVSGIRRFGYVVAIAVNFFLIYIAQNLLSWNIPFLTGRFNDCLWVVNLSLASSIFINFIFLFFNAKWFRHFMQSISNIFKLISIYVFYRIFPLALSETTSRSINLALIILIVILALSILVELVNSINSYSRSTRNIEK